MMRRKLILFLFIFCIVIGFSCSPSSNGCKGSIQQEQLLYGIPDEAKKYYDIGVDLENKGNIDDAIKNYEIAVSAFRYFPEANERLYKLYDKLGQKDHSEEHLKMYQEALRYRDQGMTK